MTSAQTPTQSALAEINGSGGLVGCELSFLSGRVAVVRAPDSGHATIQVYAEGRAVAVLATPAELEALAFALVEAAGLSHSQADDWHRETLPIPL